MTEIIAPEPPNGNTQSPPGAHNFSLVVAIMVLAGAGSIMSTDLYAPTQYWAGIYVVGAIVIIALVFVGGLTPNTLALGYLFIAFGIGPLFAVVPSKAMSAVEKSAGSAAAVFGSLEIGFAGIIAALVSVFHDDTPRPFGLVVGFTAAMIIVMGVIANRMNRIGS